MNESIEVYETIRNEIIAMEKMQRNVWIYMIHMLRRILF